jgi:hypothetical protein
MFLDRDKQSYLCDRYPICDGRFYEQLNMLEEKKRILREYGVQKWKQQADRFEELEG